MKQHYQVDNNWFLVRHKDETTSKAYPKFAAETDYWLKLYHNGCDKTSIIGHKNKGENLSMWAKHAPQWCNKCYKSLPDFPKAKAIQDYFTLCDIAELKIDL